MILNLVAEKVHDIDKPIWREDEINDYLCVSPNCYVDPEDPFHWGMQNKYILKHFLDNDKIRLLSKEQYSDQEDTFYFLNIRNNQDLTCENFYDKFSQETLEFLQKTNMPILLWYPLESAGTIQLDSFISLMEKRKKYFKK